MKPFVLPTLAAALFASAAAARASRPVDLVEPRIDTRASRWIFFSSACRPFGLVNLSPDTVLQNDWGSGYLYDEPYVRSFSHIHGWQLFGVQVMPVREFKPGEPLSEANKAPFSHDDEVVKPGYHKVVLSDRDITAELTSTTRVGFHRYTYATPEGQLLFDVSSAFGTEFKVGAAELRQTSPREAVGSFEMLPTSRRKKPFTGYFVAQLSRDFTPAEIKPGAALWRFPTGGAPVLLKVALSYTSVEGARRNLDAELAHWDFDRTVAESLDEWNAWLSRIEVQGGTAPQRVKFYTDLWHALLGRRIISDADGQYPDNTGPATRLRQVATGADGRPRYNHHNFDGLWGSQWSLQNLWGLAYPGVMSAFCNTSLDLYRNGGLIPRGPSGGNYTFVMVGDQAALFLTSAYMQGIRDWDVQAGYEGLRKNAFVGGIRDRAGYEAGDNPAGGGMRFYEKTGFIPLHKEGSGGHRQPAAQTLEYNFQDWCLAQLALALGHQEDAAFFLDRSHGWTNLFDASTGYIRPKEQDGSWLREFAPVVEGKFNAPGFVEGNSANYTWFTPHDYPLLARLMGGSERAAQRLAIQFEKARNKRFNANGKDHATPWIDYGNQPATQLAYVFNHLGRPWLAQYWARQVKELTFGGTSPWSGYNDDEDQGQMGAVSAMLALGLFDILGGAAPEPRYELSAPVFDRITIRLDPAYASGKSFVITTRNNRYEHPYIQSATLNGKPLETFWFKQSDLKAGGTLELVLGPEPNTRWGRP
jgi:predicted alpha-1,2-mannosidase